MVEENRTNLFQFRSVNSLNLDTFKLPRKNYLDKKSGLPNINSVDIVGEYDAETAVSSREKNVTVSFKRDGTPLTFKFEEGDKWTKDKILNRPVDEIVNDIKGVSKSSDIRESLKVQDSTLYQKIKDNNHARKGRLESFHRAVDEQVPMIILSKFYLLCQ